MVLRQLLVVMLDLIGNLNLLLPCELRASTCVAPVDLGLGRVDERRPLRHSAKV